MSISCYKKDMHLEIAGTLNNNFRPNFFYAYKIKDNSPKHTSSLLKRFMVVSLLFSFSSFVLLSDFKVASASNPNVAKQSIATISSASIICSVTFGSKLTLFVLTFSTCAFVFLETLEFISRTLSGIMGDKF